MSQASMGRFNTGETWILARTGATSHHGLENINSLRTSDGITEIARAWPRCMRARFRAAGTL